MAGGVPAKRSGGSARIALRHGRDVILPYALNDKVTTIASVPLDELLAALRSS